MRKHLVFSRAMLIAHSHKGRKRSKTDRFKAVRGFEINKV